MEDNNSPNPWPPLQHSNSGSSLASVGSSQNMNDVIAAEDGNMIINKVGTTLGRPQLLPRVNVPEKIVLCLDLSTDPNFTPYRFGDGTKVSPLAMMKRIVHIFLFSKKMLNTKHQYALVVLHDDNATWLCDFTNEPKSIINLLTNLVENDQPESFDLSVLFDTLKENITLPDMDDLSKFAPPFVVRVILLYARSTCIPSFENNKMSYELLSSSPYFFLDLLYIHEPVTDDNKEMCEEVFHSLCRQVADVSELLAAFETPVRSFPCVTSPVFVEIARVMKRLAAKITSQFSFRAPACRTGVVGLAGVTSGSRGSSLWNVSGAAGFESESLSAHACG
ncbi:hypothetical protein B566_EDAN003763 [Ephemera danica]|nr:hypothetical protein B566_EDAN003763 [Ephemera danica]